MNILFTFCTIAAIMNTLLNNTKYAGNCVCNEKKTMKILIKISDTTNLYTLMQHKEAEYIIKYLMCTISTVSSSIKNLENDPFFSRFFVLHYDIKIYIHHILSEASPVSTKERVCASIQPCLI